MEQLRISIENGKKCFLPGEAIRGTVSWNLPKTPKEVELRLCWRTVGKGTEDYFLVKKTAYQVMNTSENQDFEFQIPDSPYSFSGKLISLVWALELHALPTNETVREELVVSPFGREIVLQSV